jgi:Holliday junction resolvase RusA-like endonuclease
VKQKQARNGSLLPTKRPDLDNYLKMVLDALQGVVYVDDSQIVYMISSKIYSERPGIRIEVSQYRLIELEADRASVGDTLALLSPS